VWSDTGNNEAMPIQNIYGHPVKKYNIMTVPVPIIRLV